MKVAPNRHLGRFCTELFNCKTKKVNFQKAYFDKVSKSVSFVVNSKQFVAIP